MPINDNERIDYLAKKAGDLTSYAGMVGEEFSSKVDQLAQIIGASHEGSVGSFKESLLKKCLKKYIPKKYSVGTGFIIFPEKHPFSQDAENKVDLLNLKNHSNSSQLDIIVYDNFNYSPIFKENDFVVVKPESVRSTIEVKGFLKQSKISSIITKYHNLGVKWKKYSKIYNQKDRKLHYLNMQLFAFAQHVSTNGRKSINGSSLRKSIVKSYHKLLGEAGLNKDDIPILNSAYIYDDCCVQIMSYINDRGQQGLGYHTLRGKFVKYNSDKIPHLDRDCTIHNLITSIIHSLEVPFNPHFSYVDQSMTTNICKHKHAGTTDLITGKEINM